MNQLPRVTSDNSNPPDGGSRLTSQTFTEPRVSVLVPVFNAERYLRESLDSVFSQTFQDFELVAIDDGSTDGSRDVLASYRDPRLVVVHNDLNLGVALTLNRGLMLARGAYVARLDADDIAMPERLARQVAFLDNHPDVALVGSFAEAIDPEGTPFRTLTVPLGFDEIIARIFSVNLFIHPSVLFRKSVVQDLGGFRQGALHAEDYDLWLRIIEHHEVANIPEALVRYRIHPGQASQRKLRLQRAAADRCRIEAFARCQRTGRAPARTSVARPGFWQGLRGRPQTVGSDFLDWIGTYRAMGRHDLANALIWPALASAPLSLRLYRELGCALFGPSRIQSAERVFRWYRHRIWSLLGRD